MKRRFTIPIFLIVFSLWFWAIIAEPYFMLNIKPINVAVKNFPKGFENIKIAVIGDIHLGRGPLELWRMKRIIDAVNVQAPDIVIFLGDYTNGYYYQTSVPESILTEHLSAIKAPLGKFGIFGNHDISYGQAKIEKILRASGIIPICNGNVKVSTQYGDFYIAAINDALTASYSYSASLKGISQKDPVIFLTHVPVAAREVPTWVDFILAGHTHGGQIRLPYVGNIFPLRKTPRILVAGLNEYAGHKVFTTMGLGTSRFPVRFFCPPEFTVLRIFPTQ